MLDGLVVLDLSSVGPATRAGRTLADYGAEVVKVGSVPGSGRAPVVPPVYAYAGHRGMRRVRLDLDSVEGRTAFLRLAERADVVIESWRPGAAARMGVGYDDVRAANPAIVYCSTSGYGQHGPYSQWAGHDLNYLALAGYLDCSERAPGGKPPLPGATVADAAGGGMQAVAAILAALVRRSRTGEGAYLDVSVTEGVLALMALYADEYLATGTEPGPGHYILTGRYACYDTYQCAGGGWLAVAAIEERFYRNLCRLLGCDQWADHQLDDAVQDRVRADFRSAFARRSRDEWVAELAPADCCVAPVLSLPEALADEHLTARGVVAEATASDGEPVRQLGTLLAGTPTDQRRFELPDLAATDTDEVLAGAGFSPDEIAALREKGAAA